MWEDDEEEASVVASWEGEGRVVFMLCLGWGGEGCLCRARDNGWYGVWGVRRNLGRA